jgi:class 3 adenylate cyclase
LREAFARHGGQEIKEAGDSFLVAFPGARQALACAVAGQQALAGQEWPRAVGPLKVRMALHTGDVEQSADGEYHGLVLHRASRMLTAAHGGQILLSEITAGLVRRELGRGRSA